MSGWNRLSILVAFLPGLACAADPAMLDLVMPDARMVMEIDIGKIMASPIGKTISTEVKAEFEKSKAQWQQQMAGLSGFDFTQLSDVVIAAAGAGKDAPALVIVRGSFGPAVMDSLKAAGATLTELQGVPVLTNAGQNKSTIAFLDGAIAVLGQAADVAAAIGRRGNGAVLPAALAAKVQKFNGHYDIWMATVGPFPLPPKAPAAKASAGGAGAAAVQAAQWIERLESIDGGGRFSPDFELSIEIIARTEKDAAGMAEGLRWLEGAVQLSQAKNPGNKNISEYLKFAVSGKRIDFALHVPEAEMRAALQQRRAAITSQNSPAVRTPAVRQSAPGALPPPPPGTIRVQSSPSDMGTQLIPIEKDH